MFFQAKPELLCVKSPVALCRKSTVTVQKVRYHCVESPVPVCKKSGIPERRDGSNFNQIEIKKVFFEKRS